ncbi:secreted RxLR effector protein 161-like [Phragmites australis]|uniref:secreted RxLR effector protein 161-like n=1 Tax=Phragmites australis TaxID=29695 RepID=UPI002D7726BE|nr:secreted RxLR effector protein 161-like [Phragmites australis]
MTSCNPSLELMEPRLKLSRESTVPLVNTTEYRRVINGLRYLRVLRYAVGTRDYGLYFTRKEEGRARLVGYSDADMAGDIDTRKSTSGIIFFLDDNPITWQSSKQKVVALSSCEAEYIAAATAGCQGVWLALLVTDMVGIGPGVPKLKVDNQSIIALSKNLIFHDRSKHIDIRFHYI